MISLVLLVLSQSAPALPPNHPAPAPGKQAPSADELVKKLDATQGLKDKEKPFEIASSLGRLYFGQGRYAEAMLYYQQAVSRAEAPRALYLAQKKALGGKPVPGAKEVGCEPTADTALGSLEEKAKTFVAAKNAPAAVACLKAGLAPLMEIDVMLGHSQFLLHDSAAALATYSRALELFESNAEARYARAALTLDTFGDDLPALGRAKADFERYLTDAPTSPHAPNAKRLLERTTAATAAGGLSKLTITPAQIAVAPHHPPQAGQPPVLTKEVMEAFQNAPRTPEMADNFQKLITDAEEHLARGRFQDALTAYKQVMPYQPDNARLRAGMAWTMIKLNRQPMADNVWRVATQTPDAVVELGDVLKAKGDAAGAREVWQRLKDTVPAAASKVDGKL